MNLSVDVVGLDDAVKALGNVEQKVSLRVIRGALRFAAKPTIERAQQLVPYDDDPDADEFHLRDTIGLRAESKKNRAGNATSMRFGAHRQTLPAGDPSGYKIAGGLGKSAKAPNHAQLVNDDVPFLMPAVESTSAQLVARFGEKIRQSVSKL